MAAKQSSIFVLAFALKQGYLSVLHLTHSETERPGMSLVISDMAKETTEGIKLQKRNYKQDFREEEISYNGRDHLPASLISCADEEVFISLLCVVLLSQLHDFVIKLRLKNIEVNE
ncbi:hypothetical protein E5288_WYG006592 [Bos mutus]|uniref:Uncharacterized protein n=1 Tax=Bos mutus TaxID=72004 RepID=A0A6B0R8U6_9CETA|nr:hypothetical protein [Bos mutus]